MAGTAENPDETSGNDAINRIGHQCKRLFEGGLAASLEDAMNKLIASITPDLTRAVLSDPPPRFRGLFPATPEAAAAYVDEELRKCLPSAADLVEGMRVNKFYKDVTYGVLKDRGFMERVLAQIPKSTLDGALLDEFIAAEAGEGE